VTTDLKGNVVWYYDVSHSGLTLTFPGQSLVPGGTVLLIGVDAHTHLPNARNILREIDLAGDTLRETNLDAVNAELTALGLLALLGTFSRRLLALDSSTGPHCWAAGLA
jgi:hypothetical protein